MRTKRNWIVGLAVVALVAAGAIALAGNGFAGNREFRQAQAGTCTCESPGECTPALDGTGNGACAGFGQGLWENRPMDGTGYGAGRGAGFGGGMRACGGR